MADLQETLDLRRRARRRLIGAIALVLALVIVPPWIMDLEPKPVQSKLTVEIPSQDAARLKPPPKPPVGDASKAPAGDAAKAAEAPKPPEAPAKTPDAAKSAEAAKSAANQSTASAASKSMDARTVAALGAPRTAESEPPRPDDKVKPADPKSADPKPAESKPADARPAEPAKKAPDAVAKAEGFVVPLGSFSNAENVKQLQARLAKEGIQTYTEAVKTASGDQTRVRAGPYASREAAEKARERVKALGLDAGNVLARQ
jgi:DedD protein